MLALSALATMLSTAQITLSAPVDSLAKLAIPYNCGYVRTRWNSSVVAGIFALEACTPFFYNETIGDYQDAFAYALYGGCTCRFYSLADDCSNHFPVLEYTGPTDRRREPLFTEPRPTWYNCYESK